MPVDFHSNKDAKSEKRTKKKRERQSTFIILYTEEVNNKSFNKRTNEKKNGTIFVLCKEEAEKMEPVYSIKVLNDHSAHREYNRHWLRAKEGDRICLFYKNLFITILWIVR